jgi:D-glycero-D-manno-heptose 1,7-bisphosphate phosphatase
MNKAVFFDRDGVINSDEGFYYVHRIADFTLNPDVAETLKIIADAGYKLILISNQGGVGKGEYSCTDVDELHEHLQSLLRQKGVELDEIYYCPHHPQSSACLCRKPSPLMVEKALARFDIDPSASFLFGDSDRDVEAGKAAGIEASFKISKNGSLKACLPYLSL